MVSHIVCEPDEHATHTKITVAILDVTRRWSASAPNNPAAQTHDVFLNQQSIEVAPSETELHTSRQQLQVKINTALYLQNLAFRRLRTQCYENSYCSSK